MQKKANVIMLLITMIIFTSGFVNHTSIANVSQYATPSYSKSIEFREIKAFKGEKCSDFSHRAFEVYKNGHYRTWFRVVSHNDEWWDSCPFDCTLCSKVSKSKYSLKQFLIRLWESQDGRADSYILTEL
jgi:hypothetical protein